MVDSNLGSKKIQKSGGNRNKKLKIITAIVVAVVVVVTTLYIFFGKSIIEFINNQTGGSTNTINTKEQVSETVKSAQQALSESSGDLKKAYAVFDKAIKNTSPDVIYSMYISKASVAFNNQDNEMAIKTAMLAIDKMGEIKSSTPYGIVATSYERMENYQKAKEYYEKAIDILVSPIDGEDTNPSARAKIQIERYRQKITKMESLL